LESYINKEGQPHGITEGVKPKKRKQWRTLQEDEASSKEDTVEARRKRQKALVREEEQEVLQEEINKLLASLGRRRRYDWRVESLRKFLKKESGGLEPKPGNKLKLLGRIAALLQSKQKHD